MTRAKISIFIAGVILFVSYGLYDFNKSRPRREAAYSFAENFIRESKELLAHTGPITALRFADGDPDQLGKDPAYRIVYKLTSGKGHYTAYISVVQAVPTWRVHQLELKDETGHVDVIVDLEKR